MFPGMFTCSYVFSMCAVRGHCLSCPGKCHWLTAFLANPYLKQHVYHKFSPCQITEVPHIEAAEWLADRPVRS